MNSNLSEIGIAIVLAALAVGLVFWYLSYKSARSRSRMLRMVKRIGLDPEIFTSLDNEAIANEVRRKCQKCQAEDPCERWLKGDVEGANTFCPNAEIFELMKQH